jgi:hypothetical protein
LDWRRSFPSLFIFFACCVASISNVWEIHSSGTENTSERPHEDSHAATPLLLNSEKMSRATREQQRRSAAVEDSITDSVMETTPVDDDDDDTSDDSTAARAASPACLASLCLCMLTHSYLLISVFPYSGYMAIHMIESATEETAGSYAGLIASAFMLGRGTTGYLWGKVADSYGRTTVLYLSLGAACFFSIAFGLAPTFASALVSRFRL